MKTDKFPVYLDHEEVPCGYVPLTHAWDMLNHEKEVMLRECDRLQAKGEEVCIKLFDNRNGGEQNIRTTENHITTKKSLYGEIWVQR